jgi:uncharacterized surface anchored protein
MDASPQTFTITWLDGTTTVHEGVTSSDFLNNGMTKLIKVDADGNATIVWVNPLATRQIVIT